MYKYPVDLFADTAVFAVNDVLDLRAAGQVYRPEIAQYIVIVHRHGLACNSFSLEFPVGGIGVCIAAIAQQSVLSVIFANQHAIETVTVVVAIITVAAGIKAVLFHGFQSSRKVVTIFINAGDAFQVALVRCARRANAPTRLNFSWGQFIRRLATDKDQNLSQHRSHQLL